VITIFEAGKTLKALGLEGLFIICRALELFLMAAKSGQGNRSAFYLSAEGQLARAAGRGDGNGVFARFASGVTLAKVVLPWLEVAKL